MLALLDKQSGQKNCDNSHSDKSKRNKSKGNKSKNKKYKFKYIAPKTGEPYKKEVNSKTYYYCNKLYGSEGVPI